MTTIHGAMRMVLGSGRQWFVGVAMAVGGPWGCTYAPAEPIVRMVNHARRPGSDSVALAVYVARLRRPTWLAAFPDGGRPLVQEEYGLFYFCVAPRTDLVSLRRLAALPRPPEMATGFTPWVARWEGPDTFTASLRGYTVPEDRPSAIRVRWLRVRLAGTVAPQVTGPPALPPATSLPRACETASVADARQFLDRIPRGP